ncbi:MAG: hypothetical protein K2I96_14205 [Lachnospiraceae bacterium]|nr:hypothetical protein [Lachnospiraceae bacterium]
MNKIDVRALKLNKWYIPKTFPEHDQEEFIAVGYFDTILYKGIQIDPQSQHPFISGYQVMSRWKREEKEHLIDYSSQEQILYTNIGKAQEEDGTCFAEETINRFWNEVDSPYLFLSMVHIEHTGNLETVLKKIKDVFEQDFLSYVSFDYCDIIIFAKKLRIKQFLDKVKELYAAYRIPGKRAIVDTFSMVSFNMKYFEEKSEGKDGQDDEYKSEKFQATINLSVRDYEGFREWYQNGELEGCPTNQYKMFGRHDISIVNENADNEWLMNVMRKFRRDRDRLFWTLETFIKLDPDDIHVERLDNDVSERVYQSVKCELEQKIGKLNTVVKELGIEEDSNFVLAVCEVRDCICSILKNSFAEEFIYCMYESFQHFIEYMTAEFQSLESGYDGKRKEKLAEMYDKYFTALNTLVNSTMHGERQFIQATAFNAIFYTVPPKIMAFYNAYISRVREILTDKGCSNKFTFLIYPSFSPVMSVKSIASEDRPPCDRIITIKIREKTMYDIMDVSHQIVHELAHFIGADLRCRDLRKKYLLYTMLSCLVTICYLDDKDLTRVLRMYVDETGMELKGEDGETFMYMDEMSKMSGTLVDTLLYDRNDDVRDVFKKYYRSAPESGTGESDKTLFEMGIIEPGSQTLYKQLFAERFGSQKYEIFRDGLQDMPVENLRDFWDFADGLLPSVYRECYADLQMVLILGVGPENYLNMFTEKNDASVEQLFSYQEDNIRVSVLFKVMTDCGLWDITEMHNGQLRELIGTIIKRITAEFEQTREEMGDQSDKLIQSMVPDIQAYQEEIKKCGQFRGRPENAQQESFDVEELLRNGRIFIENSFEMMYFLYEYLLNVMKVSLAEYRLPEKREKIKEIHDMLRTLLDFNSIVEVYNCIEGRIYEYKDILFGKRA